jgi:C4-dicarboxylate-specific signal transduction histidine kinase
LISKLSSRRKQYLQELKKQREQSLDREVRAIVERLQSQEIPVTIARVNAELKGKHRWEDPKIRRALNAALEISKTSPDQSANRRKAA